MGVFFSQAAYMNKHLLFAGAMLEWFLFASQHSAMCGTTRWLFPPLQALRAIELLKTVMAIIFFHL